MTGKPQALRVGKTDNSWLVPKLNVKWEVHADTQRVLPDYIVIDGEHYVKGKLRWIDGIEEE